MKARWWDIREGVWRAAGLEGLKQLLRSFEWLMERLMPRAKAHLEVSHCCSTFQSRHLSRVLLRDLVKSPSDLACSLN